MGQLDIEDLSAGPDPPRVVHALVEIPRGGVNKYEFVPQLGLFRLDRALLSAVHYPTEYGFIPRTLGGDGDPLDVLVLTNEPTFTGCLIEARVVGLLSMRDEKGDDEKVLAVPAVDPRYESLQDLPDVSAHLLQEIEHFFLVYKDLEQKHVETFGWEPRAAAHTLIEDSIRRASE